MKRRTERTRSDGNNAPSGNASVRGGVDGTGPKLGGLGFQGTPSQTTEQLSTKLADAIGRWIAADEKNRAIALAIAEAMDAAAGGKDVAGVAGKGAEARSITVVKGGAGGATLDPAIAAMVSEAERLLNPIVERKGGGEPAVANATGVGSVAAAAGRKNAESRAEVLPELSLLLRPDPRGLVGGIALPPTSAPGVELVATKPTAKPASRRGGSGARAKEADVSDGPEDALERERALAMQRIEHYQGRVLKCAEQKDYPAVGQHVTKIIDCFEAYAAKFGAVRPGSDAAGALAATIDGLPHKLTLTGRDDERLLRILSLLDDEDELSDGPPTHPNPAAIARPLLAGKVVVLVGGNRRDSRKLGLIRDLNLGELRWLHSTPSKPATALGPDIKREEVALVLVAIRWVRHATAWSAAESALKYNKPLVRLPGGLGSNAVAHEILEQVGKQLGA